MPIEAMIGHLASWTPSGEWLSSSREGFARVLSTVVGQKPEAFSQEAHRFLDARIRPVYSYHLLFGLRNGVKNGARLDWRTVMTLISGIVEHAQSGMLPVFSRDAGEGGGMGRCVSGDSRPD